MIHSVDFFAGNDIYNYFMQYGTLPPPIRRNQELSFSVEERREPLPIEGILDSGKVETIEKVQKSTFIIKASKRKVLESNPEEKVKAKKVKKYVKKKIEWTKENLDRLGEVVVKVMRSQKAYSFEDLSRDTINAVKEIFPISVTALRTVFGSYQPRWLGKVLLNWTPKPAIYITRSEHDKKQCQVLDEKYFEKIKAIWERISGGGKAPSYINLAQQVVSDNEFQPKISPAAVNFFLKRDYRPWLDAQIKRN